MPQWRKKEVAKLRNTFPMYVKFPKDRWGEIEKAEDDHELFSKLSAEFVDTFWNENKGVTFENSAMEINPLN